MPRDLYLYVCHGDYENDCGETFESYRPEHTCPLCGGQDVEVIETHYYQDRFGDR